VAEIPRIVSVDDHVIEPAHLFERWLPSRYKDRGPKHQRKGIAKTTLHGGSDYRFEFSDDAPMADMWVYEDLISPLRKNIASAGFPREEMSLTSLTYDEIRPGCFDPVERLKDMDVNWTEASLCFPTFPRFCGQTFKEAKDKEVALACVRAYNDWMVEEWCGDSGGRLIPLIIIPLWDVQLAVQEVERNAARGVRAVTFSELPAKLGLPSIHTGYWDPFFAACADNGVVVNMHIGSSSSMATASPDAPPAVQITLSFTTRWCRCATTSSPGCSSAFPRSRSRIPRVRWAGSPSSCNAPTMFGTSIAGGRASPTRYPSRRRPTSCRACIAASSATRSASM
jgi:hypothetical protein